MQQNRTVVHDYSRHDRNSAARYQLVQRFEDASRKGETRGDGWVSPGG